MNLLESANYCIEIKQLSASSGLAYYTQSHCQVTVTDEGYRIYRTPNLTQADTGNVMYGGMVLRLLQPNPMALIKGRTYVITFNVKGKSSGAATNVGLFNNTGWGGGGLNPQPSNVVMSNPVQANFSSSTYQTFFYKFTINDEVYKVCTTSYSSFVSGTTYPSYRDFLFGFGYANTGTMGTELYIKNLRMYDVTGMDNMSISKNGVMDYLTFIENLNETDIARIYRYGEVRGNNFYEI